MGAADLLQWGFEATLASSVAIVMLLALRNPLRRFGGAQTAYLAWALVPLAIAAVSLPAPVRDTLLPQIFVDAPRHLSAAVTVGVPRSLAESGDPAISPTAAHAWLAAWGSGAAALALLFAWQQRRYVAGLVVPVHPAPGDRLPVHLRHAQGSPAVVGAWRPRIVLPHDFESRWSEDEARLILAHECAHIARGDTRANLVAAVLSCVFWFNPLVHGAARRFRRDQELACDADVLARHPNSRRAYAGAMLKAQLAVPGLPVGCHWQSSQSLKERIMMLKAPLPGVWRRRAGALAVAAVLGTGSYAAWALQAPGALESTVPVPRTAYATLARDSLTGLELSGSAIDTKADGTVGVRLNPQHPATLKTAPGAAEPRWTLSLWSAGTPAEPEVRWELSGDAMPRSAGRQQIARSGTRLDVELPAAADGTPREVGLSPFAASGAGGSPAHALTRDPDGVWRDRSSSAQGAEFGGVGEAMLVGVLDGDGRVRDVQIESMSMPGLIDARGAHALMGGMRYRVPGRDGGTEGVRVRRKFGLSPPMPPSRTFVAVAGESGGVSGDTQYAVLTPPAYPPQALADRIGGHVLLNVLVAADGSVKDARVAVSQPEGVFDAAALEAARAWRLKPQVRDGGAFEGWVQIPVDFSPDAIPGAGDDDRTAKR